MSKISVVIPIYNSENYLRECLDSLLSQTFTDFEIICVDDGSKDSTPLILDEYKKLDSRIKVFRKNNEGAGSSRNYGFLESSSDYVLFFDSDDFLYSNALEKLYTNAITSNSDITICNSRKYNQDKNAFYRNYKSIRLNYTNNKIVFSPHEIPNSIFQFCVGWAFDKLYRRSFIIDNNLEFQNIRHSNDAYFVLLSLVLADKISIISDTLLVHRSYLGSLSTTREKEPSCFFFAITKIFECLNEKDLFLEYRISFINFVVSFFLWHYNTISDIKSKHVILDLIIKFLKEIKFEQYPKCIFYNKNEYCKIKKLYNKGL